MPDPRSPIPDGAGPEAVRTAVPSVGARVLAFAAIVLAGAAGGFIGYAFVDLQSGDSDVTKGIGALVGALIAAGGTAVVVVLTKMKPDAAAGQITTMDELTAAALVSKLSPKASSLVLAEMDATKAARLTAIIANAGEIATKLESMANAQHQ